MSWTPLGLDEDPVSGQRCLFWLEKGLASPGLGDTPEGAQHVMDGTFFAGDKEFNALHPLIKLPAPLGDAPFMMREGSLALPVQLFSHWRPVPPPPGHEVPEGMSRCNSCGNVMRKVPSREEGDSKTTFYCPDCHRKVIVTVEIIQQGKSV